MEFKFGAVAVASVFLATFALTRWKATSERFKGVRVAGVGLLFAAGGLLLAAIGKISLAIPLIAIAFPFYVVGAVIHLRIIFGKHAPKPTQWDGD